MNQRTSILTGVLAALAVFIAMGLGWELREHYPRGLTAAQAIQFLNETNRSELMLMHRMEGTQHVGYVVRKVELK